MNFLELSKTFIHRFIPNSGDALIAQEKLFPNADATKMNSFLT